MTLHKLTAGDGYTYLTRQVAAHDSTERGFSSLGDYYAAKGESPGVWAGNGLTALGTTGVVTEQQMKNLFGAGIHPDADRIIADATAQGLSAVAAGSLTRLGSKFPGYTGPSNWHQRLSAVYAEWNTARGVAVNQPIPPAVREQLRTDLATAMFTEEHHRAPLNAHELSGFLAQRSRPPVSAVAGFDMTFSPVKSVSTLWAVAPRELSEVIESAHHAAVHRTLTWLETEAGYTRVGTRGPAQVQVRGLVMAVFTHRESRAGDPDLHTHVAVSNKVQTHGGDWRALDARMLYRLNVAGSEHYNTTLEQELSARLGLTFAERAGSGHTEGRVGKRPVREIVGVDPRLNDRWSTRVRQISTLRTDLTAQFLGRHGRLPTTVEMIALSQQANLATRAAKHAPQSLHDQRTTWRQQAVQVLGDHGLDQMLATVTSPHATPKYRAVTPALVHELAAATISTIGESRALWRESNITAEALRQVRAARVDSAVMADLASQVTCTAIGHSITIGDHSTAEPVPPPAELTRSDGESVFRMVKGQLFTSKTILQAETRILAAAGRTGARTIRPVDVELAALEWSANHQGRVLNHSQAALAMDVVTSGKQVQLALAPAGSGKTTVMGVLAAAWRNSGGTVIGLAPQASAAQELGDAAPGITADTVDKLVHELSATPERYRAGWVRGIGPETLVIIDEAGLASTPKLDTAIAYVTGRHGRVLLIGDDRQRAAIGAGGILRDIETLHGAVTLDEILRFTDPLEGQASLAVRDGDIAAAGYFADRGRLHAVTPDTAGALVYAAWAADIAAGHDSIMIAPTLQIVADLNAQARTDRIRQATAAGEATGRELELPSGEHVSAGDTIITKRNNRTLHLASGADYVKNNHRFTVTTVHPDGSITATEHRTRTLVTLPAAYVRDGNVRLGYAHTHASVQGLTVGTPGRRRGTAHTIVTPGINRNDLYPALTRAVDGTHAYVILGGDGDPHDVIRPEALAPPTATEVFTAVLTRDGTPRSVTTEIADQQQPRLLMGPAAYAYVHAITVGAETLIGPERIAQITAGAETTVPGISTSPAWETLRGHLAVLAADGKDPIALLTAAATGRELDTATDLAAVLDYRLDPSGNHSQHPGPLPWLPAIPAALAEQPEWHPYLTARAQLISARADALRQEALGWTVGTAPVWAVPYLSDSDLLVDLVWWRATESVPLTDLRPAGETPARIAMRHHHRNLVDRAVRVAGDPTHGSHRWAALFGTAAEHVVADDFWPVLVGRLNVADTAGLPVGTHIRTALKLGPLPAETPGSAMWWRLAPHLGTNPTSTGTGHPGQHRVRPRWTPALRNVLGDHATDRILTDRLWPTIVTRIDAAERAGFDPNTLITHAAGMLAAFLPTVRDHELAVILLSDISTLTDPQPADDDEAVPPENDDLEPNVGPERAPTTGMTAQPIDPTSEQTGDETAAEPVVGRQAPTNPLDYPDALPDTDRDYLHSLVEPDPVDDTTQPEDDAENRASAADADGALERIFQVLAATAAFYAAGAAESWVPGYLTGRGLDPGIAGYAPAGWTTTIDHLRDLGFTDREITAAGLARTSRLGILIDLFRDRAVLPLHDTHGRVIGFTGRKPAADTDRRIPKYVNSPTTAVYDKSTHLYGLTPTAIDALKNGADLIIVEGPLDAAAVSTAVTASASKPLPMVAVSPLGASLTSLQLHTLSDIAPLADRRVIVAFDNDPAGRAAAGRAYPLLTRARANPQFVAFTGKDAADDLHTHGLAALLDTLIRGQRPLVDLVLDRIIATWPPRTGTIESRIGALNATAPVIAELPVVDRHWQAERVGKILGLDAFTVLDTVDRHTGRDADHGIDNELADRWRQHHRTDGDTARIVTLIGSRFADRPDVVAAIAASASFPLMVHDLRAAGRRGTEPDTILRNVEPALRTDDITDPAVYVASAAVDRTTSTVLITDRQRTDLREAITRVWADHPALTAQVIGDPAFDQVVASVHATVCRTDVDLDTVLRRITAENIERVTAKTSHLTYQLRLNNPAESPAPLRAPDPAVIREGAAHVLRQAWIDHPSAADRVINQPEFRVLADRMAAAEHDGIDTVRVLADLDPTTLTAPGMRSPTSATAFAFDRAIKSLQTPSWQQRPHGHLDDTELDATLNSAEHHLIHLTREHAEILNHATDLARAAASGHGPAVLAAHAELATARDLQHRLDTYTDLEEQWHTAARTVEALAAERATTAQPAAPQKRMQRPDDVEPGPRLAREEQARLQARDIANRASELRLPVLPADRHTLRDRTADTITAQQRTLTDAAATDRAAANRAVDHVDIHQLQIRDQRHTLELVRKETRIRRSMPPGRRNAEATARLQNRQSPTDPMTPPGVRSLPDLPIPTPHVHTIDISPVP